MTCYHATDGPFLHSIDQNILSKRQLLSDDSDSCSSFWSRCVRKYCCGHKCVTSKSPLIALFWSFLVSVMFGCLYQYIVLRVIYKYNVSNQVQAYSVMAFLFCFYPLAGCLADIKFGRYKTIDGCMHILLIMLLITMILQLLSLFLPISFSYDDNWTIIGQIIHIILWIFILSSVICCQCKYHSVWHGPAS